MAQVASARLSERVPGSILGDLNVCFDFLFFTFQFFSFSFQQFWFLFSTFLVFVSYFSMF